MITAMRQPKELPGFETPEESGIQPIPPRLIENHLAIADRVIENWKKTAISVVDNDRIEFLHARREEYRQVIANWIDEHERFNELLKEAMGPDYDEVLTVMAAAQKGLKRLKTFSENLFARWKTLEDLEWILAEATALPNKVLLELAKKYPPPEEWLQKDEPRPW
jgi:hypothetical protein